ncbi:tetratricopeptide repeat protein [bacterium]|nr:tetratricopeptide repeat protein [bacterium]
MVQLGKDLESFEAELKKNPLDANINFDLATIHYRLNHIEEAKKFLAKVIFLNPKDFEATLLLGKIQRKAGDLHFAGETLQKASKLAPDNGEAWYEKGLVFSDLGQYDDAIQALQTAFNLSKPHDLVDLPYLRLYIGVLALAKGDYQLADQEVIYLKSHKLDYAKTLQNLINLSR